MFLYQTSSVYIMTTYLVPRQCHPDQVVPKVEGFLGNLRVVLLLGQVD